MNASLFNCSSWSQLQWTDSPTQLRKLKYPIMKTALYWFFLKKKCPFRIYWLILAGGQRRPMQSVGIFFVIFLVNSAPGHIVHRIKFLCSIYMRMDYICDTYIVFERDICYRHMHGNDTVSVMSFASYVH